MTEGRTLLPSFPTLGAFLLSCLATTAGAQSVLVVDAANGPGAQFTGLREAVEAAAEGDVLLIRAGAYRPTTALCVSAKTLVLQADTGAEVSLEVGFCIEDLGKRQFVAARGIDFRSGVLVEDCDGPVWLEDAGLDPDPASGPGAVIRNSRAVVLRACSVRSGYSFAGTGTAAVEASDSGVFAFECTFEGHAGVDGVAFGSTLFPADPGSPALFAASGADVWIQDCAIRGGDGGGWSGFVNPTQSGEDGGPGVRALDGATVNVVGTSAQGGVGGSGSSGGSAGASGLGVELAPLAELVEWPDVPRSLHVPSPLREGQAFDVTYEGLAGDSVWALLSTRPGFALSGFFTGPVVAGVPLLAASFQGLVPGPGVLSTTGTAPGVGAGSALVFFDQALFLGPQGRVAGAPTLVLVLDEAF